MTTHDALTTGHAFHPTSQRCIDCGVHRHHTTWAEPCPATADQ